MNVLYELHSVSRCGHDGRRHGGPAARCGLHDGRLESPPRSGEPLVARGARAADSPKAAASGADLVISMVADDAASRAVWLGPDGALAGAAPGTVVIESSTLSPAWIDELAGHAATAGCELLDAPVTGSRTHAASGELLFLVGGAAATLERARPALAAWAAAASFISGRQEAAPA